METTVGGAGDATPDATSGPVLVRVFAHGPSWPRTLPTVPAGATVAATVSDAAIAAVPTEDLVGSGYRIVGVVPGLPAGSGAVVDLLVPTTLAATHPVWWRQLLGVAERAFDLSLGPVRYVLGAQVERFEAAGERVGVTAVPLS